MEKYLLCCNTAVDGDDGEFHANILLPNTLIFVLIIQICPLQ